MITAAEKFDVSELLKLVGHDGEDVRPDRRVRPRPPALTGFRRAGTHEDARVSRREGQPRICAGGRAGVAVRPADRQARESVVVRCHRGSQGAVRSAHRQQRARCHRYLPRLRGSATRIRVPQARGLRSCPVRATCRIHSRQARRVGVAERRRNLGWSGRQEYCAGDRARLPPASRRPITATSSRC